MAQKLLSYHTFIGNEVHFGSDSVCPLPLTATGADPVCIETTEFGALWMRMWSFMDAKVLIPLID